MYPGNIENKRSDGPLQDGRHSREQCAILHIVHFHNGFRLPHPNLEVDSIKSLMWSQFLASPVIKNMRVGGGKKHGCTLHWLEIAVQPMGYQAYTVHISMSDVYWPE